MKKVFLLIIITSLILSCEKSYQPRENIEVSILNTQVDSSSIRAIEIINDSTVVYAGSKGDLGVLRGRDFVPISSKIVTDTIVPHFRSLAFTKSDLYALSIGSPALLYKYSDNKIELVYKEDNEKVFYDSMKFFDDLNGIAIGDPIDNCLSIIITRDGGSSWGKMKCEDLPETEDGEAAFAASNTNISIVGQNAWIVTGGKRARVFHTPDMGLTWNTYNTPIVQGKETTGIYSVAFYNENQGIICGGDYLNKNGNLNNIATTNDGGKTWELVKDVNRPKYVSCVQYIPNTDGYEVIAVSTNGVFYSYNKGVNWKKINDLGYYSIRMATKNSGWLSGNEVLAKLTIK